MASVTSNPSSARTRTLRVPSTSTVKSPPLSNGPSYIALFLTNLRLLDLDTRDDWPDIDGKTFLTGGQQNQKKRIGCVEWALYHLFALWDPEETRNKLQPFFPPLEQLQSLNLRNALFRCLDTAKKAGALGRDTVLRKTMLDECKGERLEEVLAVFSNVVLKRVLQQGFGLREHAAIAQQLALENFSYTGERTVLNTLIVAHKAILSKHLRQKNDARDQYNDFAGLINLNDRRIARRHEQLKQAIEEGGAHEPISKRDIGLLKDRVQRNWSGNSGWLDTVLHGDGAGRGDGLLATPFEEVWKHVERGSTGELEAKIETGLLEQLDARVKDQETRLARWQDFGKCLAMKDIHSPSKKDLSKKPEKTNFNLGFNLHQTLQINRCSSESIAPPATVSLMDYGRLMNNMKLELAEVGKPQIQNKRPRLSLVPGKRTSAITTSPNSPILSPIASPEPIDVSEAPIMAADDERSSVSDSDRSSLVPASCATNLKSGSQPPESPPAVSPNDKYHISPKELARAENKTLGRAPEIRSTQTTAAAISRNEPTSPPPVSIKEYPTSPPTRRRSLRNRGVTKVTENIDILMRPAVIPEDRSLSPPPVSPMKEYSEHPSSPPPRRRSIIKPKSIANFPATIAMQNSSPASTPKPSSPKRLDHAPPSLDPPKSNLSADSDFDLADQILNSMAATSPSPQKPRHTLSLAERTRLSMARFTDSNSSNEDLGFDSPKLSIKTRTSMAPSPIVSPVRDEGPSLAERTRKSMAGFEAVQKKVQIDRRRSVKESERVKSEKERKKRESTYFPRMGDVTEEGTEEVSVIELMEAEAPDYGDVFKSRPKIAMSPAGSLKGLSPMPSRETMDEEFGEGSQMEIGH